MIKTPWVDKFCFEFGFGLAKQFGCADVGIPSVRCADDSGLGQFSYAIACAVCSEVCTLPRAWFGFDDEH